MLEALKSEVWQANLALPKHGLVTLTWGNVSAVDATREWMVIKPSGVAYEDLKPEDMVVLRISDGVVVEGSLRPSSDTPAHLVLYRAFGEIKGVVHTHSTWATIWAQAGQAIPVMGTTHADFAGGPIPCTRDLRREEVQEAFEANTGKTIVETFAAGEYKVVPAVLVRGHGPFCWGSGAMGAVHHAIMLEEVAKMAYYTQMLNPKAKLNPHVASRHFSRKHGPQAYYGQT